jgi:hypothetical protein
MANIFASAPACNRGVCVVYAYIDTVEIFFRYVDRKSYHALNRIARMEPVRRNNRLVGYRAIVNQPTENTLYRLADFARRLKGILSRVDVALDIQGPDPEALRNAVLTTAILKWRRKQPMHEENGTISWADFRLKPGKAYAFRNLILYSDRHNKITGEVDAVHLELRFHRAIMVRRQGIHSVRDLLHLNPKSLFDKHVKFSDIAERYVNFRVRKETMRQRKRYRGLDVSPAGDRYHASIPAKVRNLFHRLGYDRAQHLRHLRHLRYKVYSSKSEHHVDFDIPEQLDWCHQVRIPPIENIRDSKKQGSKQ